MDHQSDNQEIVVHSLNPEDVQSMNTDFTPRSDALNVSPNESDAEEKPENVRENQEMDVAGALSPEEVQSMDTDFVPNIDAMNVSPIESDEEILDVGDNASEATLLASSFGNDDREKNVQREEQPNDNERPSTSSGVNNQVGENDDNLNNNARASGFQNELPIDFECAFMRCVREVRAREFEDALFQKEHFPLDYLFSLELEIDAYLARVNLEGPNERMITYAYHSWPYNHLNTSRKLRLSRIRVEVEKWEIKRQEMSYNQFLMHAGMNEKAAESIKPICIICTLDIRNTYFTPYVLDCGHSFHSRCIRKQLRKKRQCPICRSRVEHGYGSRLYFTC